MNRIENISIAFSAWLAVAFEVAFNGFRDWFGAQIGLLPALMVYVALSASWPGVVLLALVGGLMHDSFSANPLGITTLALALVGWLMRAQRDLVLRDQIYAQVMMGFIASAAVPVGVVLALTNTHQPVPMTWRLGGQVVVMAVGGAVATPLVFLVFQWLGRWFIYQPLPESHYRDSRQIKRTRN